MEIGILYRDMEYFCKNILSICRNMGIHRFLISDEYWSYLPMSSRDRGNFQKYMGYSGPPFQGLNRRRE